MWEEEKEVGVVGLSGIRLCILEAGSGIWCLPVAIWDGWRVEVPEAGVVLGW